jgi:transcriptional regulator with XRE-family HTH domain
VKRDRKAPAGDIEVALGKAIARLRHDKGIAQERLAYLSDINRTYMTDIEMGRRSVGIGVMHKISKGLCISFLELMTAVTEELK